MYSRPDPPHPGKCFLRINPVEMNFPDHGCLIPVFLQQSGKERLIPVKRQVIVNLSIYKTMGTCKHHSTAWCRYGVGNRSSCEYGSLIGQPVNIGGLHVNLFFGNYNPEPYIKHFLPGQIGSSEIGCRGVWVANP